MMSLKTTAASALTLVGCTALFMTVPVPGHTQFYYDGVYDGRYGGHDWYYDYYTPYTPRFNDPYPGTQGWRWKSDWELKEDVKSELAWSPFVDAEDVDVSVKDGKVTLRGTVEDQSAVHDAIDNAYEAGAKTVISKLETREEEEE